MSPTGTDARRKGLVGVCRAKEQGGRRCAGRNKVVSPLGVVTLPVFEGAPTPGDDSWPIAVDEQMLTRQALTQERVIENRVVRYTRWADQRGTTPEALQALADQTAARLAEADVAILVHAENLASILQHGVLTQFHTGNSGGVYKPWRRIEVEWLMLGLDPAVLADDRTRYGFLDLPGFDADLYDDYGDTTLVLKDAVKARSTWCAGDSMNETYTLRPTGFDSPSGDALLSQNLTVPPHETDWEGNSGYCEVQVSGPVTIDDIAYVRGPRTIKAAVEAAGLRWEPQRVQPASLAG